MIVQTEFIDLPAEATPMRTMVAKPAQPGTYPGLLLFSDIFGLTESMQRAIIRFASHGFVVAAPEIYHRIEPAGHAFDFTSDYKAALTAATRLHAKELDADTRVVLDFLATSPAARGKSLHATGFCIGGHLAFRAALEPKVRSSVAFYPTGLHAAALGGDSNVDTLARCEEIRGSILVVFGATDPHIPVDGRRAVDDALRAAKVRYLISEYDGEHAFMRDIGPRYDAAETDRAMAQAVGFLRQYE